MTKSPKVIGVITASIELTWWQANRHKVLAVAGLLIGLYIGTHQDGTAQKQPETPRPGHSTPAPATHTPGPRSTHTVLGLPA